MESSLHKLSALAPIALTMGMSILRWMLKIKVIWELSFVPN